MRTDNPVHGVMRLADGKRHRRLSDDEYEALGDALRQADAENIWPPAIAGSLPGPDRLAMGEALALALG